MRCPICGEVISDEDLNEERYVATSHFVNDPESPFWPFSDAALHQSCFNHWPWRDEFVNLYNSVAGRATLSGRRKHMLETGQVIWLEALSGRPIQDD